MMTQLAFAFLALFAGVLDAAPFQNMLEPVSLRRIPPRVSLAASTALSHRYTRARARAAIHAEVDIRL